MTLGFPVSATDPDIPTNTLTYSLEPGAPAGALISGDGLLTFASTDADVNTTNQITVRVTDDGIPPMSDTKSFNITVVSPPVIDSIALSNNFVIITWSAIAGQDYRLQYKNLLSDTNWNDMSDTIASGPIASQVDSITASSQRVYRLAVVP